MAGFLDLRLDFLFFLHGIALALLASSAWGLSHLEHRRTWWWLGLFAALQAASVWCAAIGHDFGQGSAWIVGRSALLVASFLCLFPFSRQMLAVSGGPRQTRMANLAAIALAALLPLLAALGHAAWIVPASGLVGGALALMAFHLRSRAVTTPHEAARLRLSGSAIAAYAWVAGFLLCESVVSPQSTAARLRPDWWFHALLANAVLAGIACWAVGLHYSIQHHKAIEERRPHSWSRQRTTQLAVFLVLVGVGWFASESAVQRKDAAMRDDVLLRTRLIQAAVPRALLGDLQWSDADLANPHYQTLKSLMMSLVKANPDMRFVMLTGYRGGKVYFIADSERPDSPDYSPPGQYYEEAPADYLAATARHKSFVLGPVVDHWGIWVTSSVPIGEFGPDHRWVMTEVDIVASNWNATLRGARLPVVLIMLVISLLLLSFHYHQERIDETVAKLSASEQRNSSIVEGSPNCVQMVDRQGRCVAINENGVNLLDRKREDIVGNLFVSMWPGYEQPPVENALKHAQEGHSAMFEANYIRPDGETIIWKVVMTPIRNARQSVQHVVVILIDITDFRYSEKALVAAKEAAEAANKAKSEFLAVMSHEIRTPLGGVIGMLNVLRKHPMTQEQQLYTELAHENAENLLGLLDDILDAAKVEAGKLTIETIPFEPSLEFTRVLEPMRLRAEVKGLALTWKIASDLPAVLRGDPTRLRQVLANLLSNALKFTERGSIHTTIGVAPAGPGKILLCITVKDTGIGIAHEKLARLFRRFEQADLSTTRRFGGTGLGLSIVKSLADLMGGDVQVESAQGAGSTFTFTARLGEGALSDLGHTGSRSTQDATSLPKHRAQLHVLCAEDDSTNQVAAEFLVNQMGHTIEFVENGKMAVEWLASQRATVVLMDNRMPIMDGFQATHIIRDPKSPVLDHNVYIIANTANASSGYRERCLAAGMNDYLTKPLREVELHAAFERAIEHYETHGGILPPMREEPHLPLAKPAVAAATPPPHPGPPKGMSAEELLALLDEAQEHPVDPTKNLSPEAVARISEKYFQEAPIRFAEIRDALARPDPATLARAAHSLKSSSRYVNALALSSLSAEMERLADNGKLDEIPSLFEQAQKQFQELLEKQVSQIHAFES